MNPVARKYARALWEVCEQDGGAAQAGQVQAELRAVVNAGEAWEALAHPRLREADREQVLVKGVEGRVSPLTFSFLRLVNRKRRFHLLPDMQDALQELLDAKEGVTRGEVWSAWPMTAEEVAALESRVGAVWGRRVHLALKREPSLIGGVLIVINFHAFDGTGHRRLQDLRAVLRGD